MKQYGDFKTALLNATNIILGIKANNIYKGKNTSHLNCVWNEFKNSGEVSNELSQAAQIQELCQIQVHECLKPTLLLPQSRLLLLFPENKISCSYLLPCECAVCTFNVLRSRSTLARSTVSCSAGRDQVAGWVGRREPDGREGYECER